MGLSEKNTPPSTRGGRRKSKPRNVPAPRPPKKAGGAKGRAVKVSCKGTGVALQLGDLEPFQGKMKRLPPDREAKLRRSLEQDGLLTPLAVWDDGARHYLLDGHQRLYVLKKMELEGWKIPPLPVILVLAKTRKEATEKLLLIASQYGDVDARGMRELIMERGLNLKELALRIEIPKLKMKLEMGGDRPETEFTQELLEEHQYVVLFFDNSLDWQKAQTVLGIRSVRSQNPRLKQYGVGRVLRGIEIVDRLEKAGA